MAVGDFVIVHDEHLLHGLWKLGRIEEGRDGLNKCVTVKATTSVSVLITMAAQVWMEVSHIPQEMVDIRHSSTW